MAVYCSFEETITLQTVFGEVVITYHPPLEEMTISYDVDEKPVKTGNLLPSYYTAALVKPSIPFTKFNGWNARRTSRSLALSALYKEIAEHQAFDDLN